MINLSKDDWTFLGVAALIVVILLTGLAREVLEFAALIKWVFS